MPPRSLVASSGIAGSSRVRASPSRSRRPGTRSPSRPGHRPRRAGRARVGSVAAAWLRPPSRALATSRWQRPARRRRCCRCRGRHAPVQDRRCGGVIEVDERPDAGAIAHDRELPRPHGLDQSVVRVTVKLPYRSATPPASVTAWSRYVIASSVSRIAGTGVGSSGSRRRADAEVDRWPISPFHATQSGSARFKTVGTRSHAVARTPRARRRSASGWTRAGPIRGRRQGARSPLLGRTGRRACPRCCRR
jgi:hypothetical protein